MTERLSKLSNGVCVIKVWTWYTDILTTVFAMLCAYLLCWVLSLQVVRSVTHGKYSKRCSYLPTNPSYHGIPLSSEQPALCGLRSCNAPEFIDSRTISHLLIHLFPYLFTTLRIGLFYFRAGGRKRRPNMALFILCVAVGLYFVMDACLLLLCHGLFFSKARDCLGISLQNDAFCIELNVKPLLNPSVRTACIDCHSDCMF